MGKVFSPEQITNGEIPERGAHQKAARYILCRLFDEPPKDWLLAHRPFYSSGSMKDLWIETPVRAAEIYGSTALGTATMRSDVDTLVIHHDGPADSAFALTRQVFRAAERKFNVPVEANVVSLSAAINPLRHSVDPLFHEHLRAVQQRDDPRMSVNWPADILSTEKLTTRRIRSLALRYASAKARSFARASTEHDGTIDFKSFQRALEVPGAIGRKALLAVAHPGEMITDTNDKAAMAAALETRVKELVGPQHKRGVSNQLRLSELDKEYTELLHATVEGDSTLSDYRRWLADNYLPALSAAYETSVMWSDIIEDSPLHRAMAEWGHEQDAPSDPALFDLAAPEPSYDEDIY